MRLWHSKLIPLLDGPRLLDTHMSCCNLRGLGWGKKNSAVNYVFEDSLGEDALAAYHMIVLAEMSKRNYKYDRTWLQFGYCGKRRPIRDVEESKMFRAIRRQVPLEGHSVEYFLNDVQALQDRGLPLKVEAFGSVYTVTNSESEEVNYYTGVR